MARLGEIPFGRYYGSVDSTPLFIVLAAAYYDQTGDLDFIESIWPNIALALNWIDHYGDQDGDLFVEYHRRSEIHRMESRRRKRRSAASWRQTHHA